LQDEEVKITDVVWRETPYDVVENPKGRGEWVKNLRTS
jgi:hypothetical protein